MTIAEIMGEKVELLRAQLAALPDSTASDRARKTADEIRGLLEKAGGTLTNDPDLRPCATRHTANH